MGRLSTKNQALARRTYRNLFALHQKATVNVPYLNALLQWFKEEVGSEGQANIETFPQENKYRIK